MRVRVSVLHVVTDERPRKACGMTNSWKAAKKSRRISGVNVYQQTRMRGQGLRIGTPEYKAAHASVMADWRSLSERERGIYEAMASRQQATRQEEIQKTLKDAENARADAGQDDSLSAAQKRRLGQQQLNQSLQALASHAVWQSGLGISNHVAALRPAHVQNIDPASSLLEAFDYEATAEENPAVMPHMFRSCAEAHPELCKADAHYQHVLLMVQQFQRCLEVHKIESMALFKVEVNVPGVTTSQIPALWLLLGCVSKRPLSHVFGRLVQHRHVAEVVTPWVEDSAWKLCTLHGVLRCLTRDLAAQGVMADDVRVRFHCYTYDAISCEDAPNHFRLLQDALQFQVGFRVPFVAKPVKKQQDVQLPFGMKFSAPPRSRGRPKGKSQPSVAKAPKAPADDQGGEAGQDDDLLDADEANPDVAPASAFAFRNMSLHDAHSLCPAHLPGAAQEEVAEAARSVVDQHLDAEAASEPSFGSGGSRPAAPAPAPPPPAPAPAAGKSKFNKELGLVGCAVVKRRSICCTCNQQIHKGDYRLEYSYNLKKPPRSVHPECVAQIDAKTFGASISWLQGRLRECLAGDDSEEVLVMQHALQRLQQVHGP